MKRYPYQCKDTDRGDARAAPLRLVVSETGASVALDCGHRVSRLRGQPPKRRRCLACKRAQQSKKENAHERDCDDG